MESREILVSEGRGGIMSIGFMVTEDSGHNVGWESGGLMYTVHTVGEYLVAIDIKTKLPTQVWKSKQEMVRWLRKSFDTPVRFI